jgi:hypothetical protein
LKHGMQQFLYRGTYAQYVPLTYRTLCYRYRTGRLQDGDGILRLVLELFLRTRIIALLPVKVW